MTTSGEKRLAMLNEARQDLSIDDRNALNQYLIGALSGSVSDDEWGHCVDTAFQCLRAERKWQNSTANGTDVAGAA